MMPFSRFSLTIVFILLIFSNNSIIAQDNSSSKDSFLFLDSDREGVKVFINDSLYGHTPLVVENLETGKYNIQFVSDTSKLNRYNVEYAKGSFREVFGIFDAKRALLSLVSEPEGAEVFVNDSLIGYSPIKKMPIRIGVYSIKIKMEDYYDYTTKVIAKSDHYRIDAKLKYKYGFINPINLTENDLLSINGSLLPDVRARILKIPEGSKSISIQNEKYHKEFSTSITVNPREVTNIEFNYGVSTMKPFFYSMVIPGLGQFYDNDKQKGLIIFGANCLLAGITAYTFNEYNSDLDDYNEKREIYNSTTNEFLVIRNREEMLDAYEKAKDSKTIRNISIGVLIGSYIYNLVDALLNHNITGEFKITSEQNFNQESKIIFKVEL